MHPTVYIWLPTDKHVAGLQTAYAISSMCNCFTAADVIGRTVSASQHRRDELPVQPRRLHRQDARAAHTKPWLKISLEN